MYLSVVLSEQQQASYLRAWTCRTDSSRGQPTRASGGVWPSSHRRETGHRYPWSRRPWALQQTRQPAVGGHTIVAIGVSRSVEACATNQELAEHRAVRVVPEVLCRQQQSSLSGHDGSSRRVGAALTATRVNAAITRVDAASIPLRVFRGLLLVMVEGRALGRRVVLVAYRHVSGGVVRHHLVGEPQEPPRVRLTKDTRSSTCSAAESSHLRAQPPSQVAGCES